MVSHNFVVDTIRVYLAGTGTLITILAQIRPDFMDGWIKLNVGKMGLLCVGSPASLGQDAKAKILSPSNLGTVFKKPIP